MTDQFRKGCSIHIGLGKYPLCAVHARWCTSRLGAMGQAPSSCFKVDSHFLATSSRLGYAKSWLLQVSRVISPATVSALVQL